MSEISKQGAFAIQYKTGTFQGTHRRVHHWACATINGVCHQVHYWRGAIYPLAPSLELIRVPVHKQPGRSIAFVITGLLIANA
eukprot:1459049-Rhodomonas_salina.3